MKKVLIAVLLLGLAIGASALDMSAGAGAAPNFTSGTYNFPSLHGDISLHSTPVNFVAFFDATYVQISAGYMFVNGGTATSSGTTLSMPVGGSASYLSFAAYVKYPFAFGSFSVFPLLGIEYKLNLTYTDGNGNDKSSLSSQQQADLNEIWFEAGAGADFSFGRFYVRPEMFFGFKPLSTTDNNNVSSTSQTFGTPVTLTWLTVNVELLVGYKL